MREHSSKKVNVLGIDVSVMRPEKAVNLTLGYMRTRGLKTVFFLSAEASLYCQSQPWAMEYVQSCPLVLTGDRNTELAVLHRQTEGENIGGLGEFADEYLKKLFAKLNREGRDIYVIMEKAEHFDILKEYMTATYPDIYVNGTVYGGETEGEPDKVVNEINANIPDIVFFCLPADMQLMFMNDYSSMMNTRLCICVESLQLLVQKEVTTVPLLFRAFHLDRFWHYLNEESSVRKTIAGSIFKKKVMGDASGEEQQECAAGEEGERRGQAPEPLNSEEKE